MRKLNLDWPQRWAERFNSDADWKAQTALNLMVANGCDPTVILELLAGCTHPNADANLVTIRVKRSLRERLRRLERLNQQIRKTQEALQDLNTEPLVLHFRPISVELPAALRVASAFLGRPTLRKALDRRKVPRGLTLVALCLYVRRVTGRSSFRQLADLLEAGYQAHGTQNREVDPASLARRVRRFKRSHPEIVEAL